MSKFVEHCSEKGVEGGANGVWWGFAKGEGVKCIDCLDQMESV